MVLRFWASGPWLCEIFYKHLSSPVLACWLWEGCFILFILLVVDPDFGVLPVVPYLRFYTGFSRGFCEVCAG